MKRHGQTCSLWWCQRPSYSLGFCMTHYQNLRRHGDVIAPSEEDQHALRDMCDDLSRAAMDVVDALATKSCPVCGVEAGFYHDEGCAVERLMSLTLRVQSSKTTDVEAETEVTVESG